MNIPGLGEVAQDNNGTVSHKEPIPVPMFGGQPCWFMLEDYGDDPNTEEFHAAIANFLAADNFALKAAEPQIYHYYQDFTDHVWEPDDEERITIDSPADVWAHIQLGSEIYVSRRDEDKGIYFSLECNCDWEEEHGLQIVFKNGTAVNKVGSFDGHLTNSDAYADDSLENVVYRPL